MIEYFGARWKIKSGFKELKLDIGCRTSKCRNAQAETDHLQICMMTLIGFTQTRQAREKFSVGFVAPPANLINF